MSKRFATFDEFWPFYLGEHRNATCRGLHVWGSSLGLLTLAWGIATLTWWSFPLALVIGYGHSWVGHFFFEKNVPATFDAPLFSLRGDIKMIGLFYRGKLSAELERLYGSANPAADAPVRAER
ncbi:MAG: DUF962 domain-containing protein [Nannocystaceae bacterium]|nr:DUF962 domain-containing protein [Nannocystaceae bacterium]